MGKLHEINIQWNEKTELLSPPELEVRDVRVGTTGGIILQGRDAEKK